VLLSGKLCGFISRSLILETLRATFPLLKTVALLCHYLMAAL
jgi:hypothetical protein